MDAADRLSARPDFAAPIYPVVSMTLPTAHAGSRKNLIGENASPERVTPQECALPPYALPDPD